MLDETDALRFNDGGCTSLHGRSATTVWSGGGGGGGDVGGGSGVGNTISGFDLLLWNHEARLRRDLPDADELLRFLRPSVCSVGGCACHSFLGSDEAGRLGSGDAGIFWSSDAEMFRLGDVGTLCSCGVGDGSGDRMVADDGECNGGDGCPESS